MKCGATFESPVNGSSGVSGEPWEVCPVCGCDEVEEALECALCGEYHKPDDMESKTVCKSCCEDSISVLTAKLYIEARNLQREYYINWFFKSKCEEASEDLIRLAQMAWRKASGMGAEEDMLSYIEENRNDFAEWLGETLK